ncbi:cytochrome ubiquinol oxidase subunit I [Tahibacter amnicola]|uniref:Cytochrome ubiquinol oxidase subunit I n=1 Tax=Tahibacter amnicola TaxID=2976241 RepID=A0ABY6B9X7_9GAMM|nr:cytochrome ubiquinol oxidase subunit I [Tahibacter amnicola]UXI66587.1 cytochrome ubiquinol oxidase subunit I [Tahibacter amnicola]
MDALQLARMEFALAAILHIVFPVITIGLAWFLVLFEILRRRHRTEHWTGLYRFWTRILAINFLAGIATGILLGHQFATLFRPFVEFAAPVLDPLRTAETPLLAVVEAACIGVMLMDGRRGVPAWLRAGATVVVAVMLTNAGYWILCANTFMQHPTGVAVVAGKLVPVDWNAILLNPLLPNRFAHVVLGALFTAALVLAGVGAWQWRRTGSASGRLSVKVSLLALALVVPAQVLTGHLSGLHVREHQPAKFAAIEALWETQHGAPLVLWAWPDQVRQRNMAALEIPRIGSLIFTHDWNGSVDGLDKIAPQNRPPLIPVFFGFRLMVLIGLWCAGLTCWGVWLLWRGRLRSSSRFSSALIYSAPLGFVATIAGWIVAECGRQPWTIVGLLRTADAATPTPPVMSHTLVAAVVATAIIGLTVYGNLRVLRKTEA